MQTLLKSLFLLAILAGFAACDEHLATDDDSLNHKDPEIFHAVQGKDDLIKLGVPAEAADNLIEEFGDSKTILYRPASHTAIINGDEAVRLNFSVDTSSQPLSR